MGKDTFKPRPQPEGEYVLSENMMRQVCERAIQSGKIVLRNWARDQEHPTVSNLLSIINGIKDSTSAQQAKDFILELIQSDKGLNFQIYAVETIRDQLQDIVDGFTKLDEMRANTSE
jgi:hypothetical protein